MGRLRALAFAAGVSMLAGCQVGYYTHLLRGQYDLLARRVPIESVLARHDADPALKARLGRALEARRFATAELGLPDNASYTHYADLGRPYAVWNVFAAPEFSLTPHEWCYVLAGCLAYRGFYSLERARDEAKRLKAKGYDVHVGGVPAYSTLGWFDDPVLNTIAGTEDLLVATIFHELAHQRQFVGGDTAFNESFATFVEEEGLRQFLRGAPELAATAQRRGRRQERFVERMLEARRRLEALYASGLPTNVMRARKAEEFTQLRAVLGELAGADGDAGRVPEELNNAYLLPYGLYHEWVPAFAELFRRSGGDWQRFYTAVDALAAADDERRREWLEALRRAAR